MQVPKRPLNLQQHLQFREEPDWETICTQVVFEAVRQADSLNGSLSREEKRSKDSTLRRSILRDQGSEGS